MSISDAIESAKSGEGLPERRMFKKFYAWYDALGEKERLELDEALLSNEVSTRRLFQALKVHENVEWGDNSIYFHRSTLLNKQEK